MSKIAERITFEGDNMVVKKTYDGGQMIKDAEHARTFAKNDFGSDYKHVGNVDMALVTQWLKVAGVSWTDTPAVKEVIKRNLMSNEYGALRVWNGSY
jgi:hypothetical protein